MDLIQEYLTGSEVHSISEEWYSNIEERDHSNLNHAAPDFYSMCEETLESDE